MEKLKPEEPTLKRGEEGKYELTLSEFPVFLLSKRAPGNVKDRKKPEPIEYQDTITSRDGKLISRHWKIWPDSRYGHGTASTFSTLFELFQIWKEQDFSSQFINFGSIYSVLKRKGLSPTKQAYGLIKRDLDCLIGIRVEANNAFWDNEAKKYISFTSGFHLFDNYYLYDTPPKTGGQLGLSLGTIKANDVLYDSVAKNSLLIVDFDRSFFHGLTPIEQRLALYLNKIFKSQSVHRRKVLELARQIPIYTQQSRNIKQKLKKANEGLMKKGFSLLARFVFEKSADNGEEQIVFYRKTKPQVEQPKQSRPAKERKTPWRQQSQPQEERNPEYVQVCLVEDIMAVCGDEKSINFYKKVAKLIPKEAVYQAIAEVKEVRDLGTIKKSKGALFTKLIKEKAGKLEISL